MAKNSKNNYILRVLVTHHNYLLLHKILQTHSVPDNTLKPTNSCRILLYYMVVKYELPMNKTEGSWKP